MSKRNKILTKRQQYLLVQAAKNHIVNSKTGVYSVKFDINNMTEDYFIPQRREK